MRGNDIQSDFYCRLVLFALNKHLVFIALAGDMGETFSRVSPISPEMSFITLCCEIVTTWECFF